MAEYIEKGRADELLKERKRFWGGDYSALQALEDYWQHLMILPTADVQPDDRWISVEDRLPEAGEKVLIYTNYHVIAYGFFTGAYDNNKPLFTMTMRRNFEKSWYEEIRITHWQPLPEPPRDGDTNERN